MLSNLFKEGDIMKFSEAIKSIRKATFMSQESFAKEIGVSFSTVNRWERGKSKPNYSAMKKIDKFCSENTIDIDFDEEDSETRE